MNPEAARSAANPDEDPGVAANARLTVNSGLVLLVLFAIEVVTVLLSPRTVLTLHVVAGLILIPPLVVKLASVSWRFARYYRRDAAYRRKGPPTPVLRALGPFLTAATVVVLASGIVLLLSPAAFGGSMRRIHSVSFYVWLLLVAVHLLLHARDIVRIAPLEWVRASRDAVPGARVRQLILLVSLAAGLALALSLVSHVGTYKPYDHNKGKPLSYVSQSSR